MYLAGTRWQIICGLACHGMLLKLLSHTLAMTTGTACQSVQPVPVMLHASSALCATSQEGGLYQLPHSNRYGGFKQVILPKGGHGWLSAVRETLGPCCSHLLHRCQIRHNLKVKLTAAMVGQLHANVPNTLLGGRVALSI